MKNLKKSFILFLLFIASAAFTYSEESVSKKVAKNIETGNNLPSSHEIYLGIGYPNSIAPIIVGGIQDIFTAIFSGGKQGTELKSFGTSKVGYNWYCIPGKGLSIGAMFTSEPYRTEYHFKDTPEKNYSEITTLFTIQGTVKYQYGWKYFRLYHGVSLGIALSTTYDSNQKTTPIFALNIIPIGIKAGKEKGINFFADIGIGTTPIINAGASYRF